MAYSELIKSFGRIRDYMREFYVYGFRSRSEICDKSTRTYDEERRHIEDYLGDYMGFHSGAQGKQFFLSVDSRDVFSNPLYMAWKSKSFTDTDIFLHFTLLDILYDPSVALAVSDILEAMNEYGDFFENPVTLDESTVRKKLNEYVSLGILKKEKQKKNVLFRRSPEINLKPFMDGISFFSEVESCGVIGSFILDQVPGDNICRYKHHYITQTMDSEICLELLTAICERRMVLLKTTGRSRAQEEETTVTPVKIYVSTQNGRQYLMGYDHKKKDIRSYRIDYINKVKQLDEDENFESRKNLLMEKKNHIWGVSVPAGREPAHVEFTVRIEADEEHIYNRLMREKRCGTVTRLKGKAVFSADVYDAGEMLTWIRTFICRIESLYISDKLVLDRFYSDLNLMNEIYGV